VSAIVLWEIGKLAEFGRIEIDLDDAALGRILARSHIWPLTLDVCRPSGALDVRSDPADEIIAATPGDQVPLVTHDARLRRSKLVPLATPRMGGSR
jgi:PIN domain nuclease of toxin-antitoxin system